ncbi:RNA-binding transcriptional accessory protein [bacterium]|nr:MAG: RNA-binding transcriptional accessory protein [bacterium]
MTDIQIFERLSKSLGFSAKQIQVVTTLLDEGATVPFLARYRKEVTDGLDEEQIRLIRDAVELKRALEQRREAILKSIKEQEKLTPELETAIQNADDLKTLEDLYLPYKPKRKTKASVAKEKGLEPLAKMIWDQEIKKGEPEEHAKAFVDKDKGVNSVDEALQGASDIVAEWISEHIEVRDRIREDLRKFGSISSKKASSVKDRTAYESYYEFKSPIKYLKPYQTLALNRGEREGILMVSVDINMEHELENMDEYIVKDEDSVFTDYLLDATEDAYKRLLFPSLERELRNELTELADQHAIKIFATNLGKLLLQPPLKSKVVIGVDPAYRTGCKVAIVDEYGKYLEGTTIYPVPPHNEVAQSEATLAALVQRYNANLIAIGNGTASRETEQFIANFIQRLKTLKADLDIQYIIVDEAGASVYSASPLAKTEFPDLDAAQRGNISIARRVQDPLAELVKIDPKSIGVGLYQHDVNQVQLMKSLDDVVESAVNTVGVNLNTASMALLTHVSGLTQKVAEGIVKFREEKGPFSKRDQLMEVPGMGPFRFQQAAGFLRIPESSNPFDNTAIHPESYDAAQKVCEKLGLQSEVIANPDSDTIKKLKDLNVRKTAEELGIGVPTLDLIVENLQKPGRDPRDNFPQPLLRSDILKMEDLKPGQKLEGTVRNVVDFGAFVDIGVKEAGMLHVSKMSRGGEKVKDPLDVVSVGDIITVTIEAIEPERGRISLALV